MMLTTVRTTLLPGPRFTKALRCALLPLVAAFVLPISALARPTLNFPSDEDGFVPPLLSQTGAFANLRNLTPAPALIPYDLNVPFWSDGAAKWRWIVLPRGEGRRIAYSSKGEWRFPVGTVFVKHFELPTDESRPEQRRRLETRFIVINSTGGVYGVTYKWRADQSDAELLATNVTEPLPIHTPTGCNTQNWSYPSRTDCRTCHTAVNGGVLGLNARQLNRELSYPGGEIENQLRHWVRLGLLDQAQLDSAPLPRLPRLDDLAAPLQDRARAWLDANCSHCHRPGGTVATFDARFETPLAEQNLIDGPVLIDEGIDHARVLAPHDLWRSILYLRASTLEPLKMPPLAHEKVDAAGLAVLGAWIESLPGPPVLPPPKLLPPGGNYSKGVRVSLHHPDSQATLRYTLDGSVPGKASSIYSQPLELTDPATLRVRAFRPGFTKSITVQETYLIQN